MVRSPAHRFSSLVRSIWKCLHPSSFSVLFLTNRDKTVESNFTGWWCFQTSSETSMRKFSNLLMNIWDIFHICLLCSISSLFFICWLFTVFVLCNAFLIFMLCSLFCYTVLLFSLLFHCLFSLVSFVLIGAFLQHHQRFDWLEEHFRREWISCPSVAVL